MYSLLSLSLSNTLNMFFFNSEFLILTDNELIGSIPLELGNAVGLKALSIQQNGFTGRIPPALGSLDNLETLDLSVY